MISEIRIQDFKSISDLSFKPGRVTVLIGENGSGKSNILEAIAFAGAAAANKLDNEFLFNRGIRVTEDVWMVSAFSAGTPTIENESPRKIQFVVKGTESEPIFECSVHSQRRKDGSFLGWNVTTPWRASDYKDKVLSPEEIGHIFLKIDELDGELHDVELQSQAIAEGVRRAGESQNQNETFTKDFEEISDRFKMMTERLEKMKDKYLETVKMRDTLPTDLVERLKTLPLLKLVKHGEELKLSDFMIYAPENTVLRTPPPESAIQPIGAKGEGLLKLLQSFTDDNYSDRLADMKIRLRLLGWFDDFLTPDATATATARLPIRDKWLAQDRAVFDQRSANEGFLYLLFYFTLIMSWRTPSFFALDNVDNALNPKLCSALMLQIVELAKKYDKQIICTTHNPSILDGLNLHDDEQRLYTVRRDSEGRTVVNRVRPPKPQPDETPVRLSEAFMRGIIGGLPDHF